MYNNHCHWVTAHLQLHIINIVIIIIIIIIIFGLYFAVIHYWAI